MTQMVVLALFVVLIAVAAIRFHGGSKELGGDFIAADRHPYRSHKKCTITVH